MGFNMKGWDITVPFSLMDLNKDSNFKAFLEFISAVKNISDTNENLCAVIDESVAIKDTDTYDALTNLRKRNPGLTDKELLEKEKDLFCKNMYEAKVSILYDIKVDNLIIKEYAELQKKLLNKSIMSTAKVRNIYDPKRILLDYTLDLKKRNVNTIHIASIKTKNGVYKTNSFYSVPIDEEGKYPQIFAVSKKDVIKKFEMNYDIQINEEGKEKYKDNPNISFDITSSDRPFKVEPGFISSIEIDETKFSDSPISLAKKANATMEEGKEFVSVNDEIRRFFTNCTYNKCESITVHTSLVEDAYSIKLCLKVKEKDLDKFTNIIDTCLNNFEEKDYLTERTTIGPERNGNIEFVIGITEPRGLKATQAL